MVEWITIIGLVVIGLGLVIIEIILIPGTTVVGFMGLLAALGGVWISFDKFGPTTGTWVLSGTATVFGVALYLSFKSGAWTRFALKGAIKSKVNEGLTSDLSPGDRGRTMSVLKPIGKAEFGNHEFEVRSYGNYIEEDTEVQIEKIDINIIYVKPII